MIKWGIRSDLQCKRTSPIDWAPAKMGVGVQIPRHSVPERLFGISWNASPDFGGSSFLYVVTCDRNSKTALVLWKCTLRKSEVQIGHFDVL